MNNRIAIGHSVMRGFRYRRGMAALPLARCPWAGSDALMTAYHDDEWGVPVHEDVELFERLALESFQAGLSWSTILRKRDSFRAAFDGFDPPVVAAYDDADRARLM